MEICVSTCGFIQERNRSVANNVRHPLQPAPSWEITWRGMPATRSSHVLTVPNGFYTWTRSRFMSGDIQGRNPTPVINARKNLQIPPRWINMFKLMTRIEVFKLVRCVGKDIPINLTCWNIWKLTRMETNQKVLFGISSRTSVRTVYR